MNIARFIIFIHCREFKVVLHEDPHSIFAPDIEVENTLGPFSYDLSRIYTGKLEGMYDIMFNSFSLLKFTIQTVKSYTE